MIQEWCESIIDYCCEKIAVIAVGFFLILGALFALGIYASVIESRSAVIQLRKTEWECTGTQSVPTTIYVQTGKTLLPMTTYADVCVEYKKR